MVRDEMHPFFPGRGSRWSVGALLGLLTLSTLSPRGAEAACSSDHVKALAGIAHFEELSRSGAIALPEGIPPQNVSSEPPGPCPGGLCSPKRDNPIAPPPPETRRTDHWPCPIGATRWTSPSVPLGLRLELLPYAPPIPLSIDRPPRP
jgi:hypothetical protein